MTPPASPKSLLELACWRASEQGLEPSEALLAEAKRFRMAGVSLREYLSISRHERDFLVLAGVADRIEQAVRIGRACRGKESLVAAELDEGESMDREAVEAALRGGLGG